LIGIVCLATAAAQARTLDIADEHGGLLVAYQAEWAKRAAERPHVRIVGPCVSACTILVGYIPRQNICVTPRASLGFHEATVKFATDELWRIYPRDIRGWIVQHGGLTPKMIWMQAPETYRYFRKC
jgi:hypothetical protein